MFVFILFPNPLPTFPCRYLSTVEELREQALGLWETVRQQVIGVYGCNVRGYNSEKTGRVPPGSPGWPAEVKLSAVLLQLPTPISTPQPAFHLPPPSLFIASPSPSPPRSVASIDGQDRMGADEVQGVWIVYVTKISRTLNELIY